MPSFALRTKRRHKHRTIEYKGGKRTVLDTTENNTTLTFTVKGLAKGTAYTFSIKSVRTVGCTTEFSEYASVKVKTVE